MVIEYGYTIGVTKPLLRSVKHAGRKGSGIARKGIGTVIGRKTASGGRTYTRAWIYVPTEVFRDTSFPLDIGDPCWVEIDTEQKRLIVSPIPVDEAEREGWVKRQRATADHSPE